MSGNGFVAAMPSMAPWGWQWTTDAVPTVLSAMPGDGGAGPRGSATCWQ
jgi:hypothetical protein